VPTNKTSDKSALPMVGVLFQPDKFWTLYTSYAESYVPAPANAQDVNGNNPFTPASGAQIEVGAKTEGLLNGRLSATLSVFRIVRKDVLNTFGCARGTCSEQLGGERSKGLEFETNVRPLEGWQINFGYSRLDSRITSSRDPVQIGARLTNVAHNSANLWSRYDFMSGPANGLGIGVGLVYTGERAGFLPTTADPRIMPLPAYTVMDLAVYYLFDRYSVNLKVGNVFDKVYYESTGFTGQVQILPGAPRNVALSVRRNLY
jgi:iron complex outermembrane receptor protein